MKTATITKNSHTVSSKYTSTTYIRETIDNSCTKRYNNLSTEMLGSYIHYVKDYLDILDYLK